MKKTIVSLAAGFLLAGAATTSVSAQEYKVQEGDTLSGLSHEFDVSVDDLKAWNDLDSDLIVVNQLLDIQNEDESDSVNGQNIAPADEQAQEEAPAEPSDEQEADQPEAVDESANTEEETQPEAAPSDEQATEQEDPNVEEPQQEAPDNQAAEQEGNKEEETNDESDDKDADTSEGETMTMASTAYTAGCEGCSGTTADGTELTGDENVVAVDPDKIPIGSEVHVEGYGDAVAADTGGDINGDRIDLHMGDEGEANDWGRQDVKVTVK